MHRSKENRIMSEAIADGMETLLQDGFKRVIRGITSIEEVLRVANR